jgi:AraC-like DNA-binding protein
MLFLDAAWMAGQQAALGLGSGRDLQPFPAAGAATLTRPGLIRLQALLHDGQADRLEKESAAVAFAATLQARLDPAPAAPSGPTTDSPGPPNSSPTTAPAPQSGRHLRRRRAVGVLPDPRLPAALRPHAPRLPDRPAHPLQPERLRRGHPIAEVAADAGFADQAHLHRAFKRLVAATPGQYRA